MAADDGYRWRFVRLKTQKRTADPQLRAKLIQDAAGERSSMTAVAIRILCRIYNVEYQATGRISRADGDGDVLNLRVPKELDRLIAVNAAAHGRDVQDEIIIALSSHYGLSISWSGRRRVAA